MRSLEHERVRVAVDRARLVAAKICIRCRVTAARASLLTCTDCGRLDALETKTARLRDRPVAVDEHW